MKFLVAAIREAFAKSPQAPPFEDLQPPLGIKITPEEKKERDKMIVRQAIKYRSPGDVFLQRGRYVTSEELHERRERILAYQWDDE